MQLRGFKVSYFCFVFVFAVKADSVISIARDVDASSRRVCLALIMTRHPSHFVFAQHAGIVPLITTANQFDPMVVAAVVTLCCCCFCGALY
jgi:hypothetical protein